MRIARWVAAACFCLVSSAQAALISVTANSGWFAATFEGLGLETGKVNFVYDTATPDTNPDPAIGTYAGAIVAFTMTVEQRNRPDLFFTLAPAPNQITAGSPSSDWWFQMDLWLTDQSGAYPADLHALLNIYRPGQGSSSLPGLAYWNGAIQPMALVGSVGPASETDWAWNFRATAVPEPGSMLLLLGGLMAFALALRRSAARLSGQH